MLFDKELVAQQPRQKKPANQPIAWGFSLVDHDSKDQQRLRTGVSHTIGSFFDWFQNVIVYLTRPFPTLVDIRHTALAITHHNLLNRQKHDAWIGISATANATLSCGSSMRASAVLPSLVKHS